MTHTIHRKILVCDDEPHILLPIGLKLQSAGFEVTTARDGIEGWDAFQRERPDLLITDLAMPRLGGWELCRRVRQSPDAHSIPIVLLTGREPAAHVQNEMTSPIIILYKPFKPNELLQVVIQALGGQTLDSPEPRATGMTQQA